MQQTQFEGLFFRWFTVKVSVFHGLWAVTATGGVLWEEVFLEISQNTQENTCAAGGALNFI